MHISCPQRGKFCINNNNNNNNKGVINQTFRLAKIMHTYAFSLSKYFTYIWVFKGQHSSSQPEGGKKGLLKTCTFGIQKQREE